MSPTSRRSLVLLPGLLLAAVAALAQPPRAAAPPKQPPAIAVVGTRRIAKQEFDSRVAAGLQQYRERAHAEIPKEMVPLAERQMLEGLIRRELLILEAERRGILGSPEEAEAEMKREPFFNPDGRFDATRFTGVKLNQPAEFQRAIQQLRLQIGARRLSEQIDRDFDLPREEARARAERALSRAEVRFFGLPAGDFSGRYREPREGEVIAEYQRSAERWRRPSRAVLSVLPIVPDAADSAAAGAGGESAVQARARARGDSLLAALRRGANPDTLANPYGGFRRNVQVTTGNFPGFWMGDARDADAVFASRAGQFLPALVRARRGWLIVRVDESRPSEIAPLADVVREIRGRLRAAASENSEEIDLRALYAVVRDSLRGPAVRVRWAWVDTTRLATPEPTAADLDRFVKEHLGDYSYFDNASGTVRTRPMSEIGADVRDRWLRQARESGALAVVNAIEAAWRRGGRDGAAERRASGVREAGPLPPGAPVDSTLAGLAVTDSLKNRAGAPGVGSGRYAEGRLVFQVYGAVAGYVPTYEQAVPQLRERLAAARAAEEERGGRALFERDPERFAFGRTVHFTRALVPRPDLLGIALTKREVEKHYREHLDKFSAPEEVRARHILISPSGTGTAADSAARARAASILARLRAGDDFATLARQYSDDPATRASGGDLGVFGRGVMLDAVEAVAFSLEAGQISEPVRSEVGYHILQVQERLPAVAHPLATMWTIVAEEVATQKADALASQRADSLYAALTRVRDYRAAVRRAGFVIQPIQFDTEDPRNAGDEVLARMASLAPGTLYPGAYKVRGAGFTVSWVDSITPARKPEWTRARERAIDAYRQGAGQRSLEAKRAELDSLFAAGWSLDSVATLWGGLLTYAHARGGPGLPVFAGGPLLDSLLIGTPSGPAALAPGATTGWIQFPYGIVRLRYASLSSGEPSQVAARAENERRSHADHRLLEYFDGLKRRFPVRILDPDLARVELPPLPELR